MRADLHFGVDPKTKKRILLGVGHGAGFGRAGGLRSSLVVRDVEVGEPPKAAKDADDAGKAAAKVAFDKWHAELEAKYAAKAK